ncbi:MAG: ATP-dependent protease ATPase subunit HslU [Candidatus Muirbacterium halophilum]|nr:ATP-dependent protease ATPase subunit HslU [Candidatus Muirbacterium halophilum]MCK9474457.1 ATP-dependent protease ATPase subunit HslU [Candidatus Muirbacterium halophilum]
MNEFTPKQIVEILDRFVIGQKDAKKAVAIALRNRYRRRLLEDGGLKEEIMPKNIIMIGPTGVGKTEIARRIAKFINAPFLKVEVTKYTEVGYVGRDVESMVRDLFELAISREKSIKTELVKEKALKIAKEKVLDILIPKRNPVSSAAGKARELFDSFIDKNNIDKNEIEVEVENNNTEEKHIENDTYNDTRKKFKKLLEDGKLDLREIEIEVKSRGGMPMFEVFSGGGMEEFNIGGIMGGILGQDKKKKQKVKVKDALELLTDEEASKLIDMEEITREAKEKVENSGIIFLDEIDKIIGGQGGGSNPNVSREGVQRDLLPLVEGSTVMTKHGTIKTDHILFIAAGAFYSAKPSDLVPELQGRFPIRVELHSLNQEDFVKILKEPENALIKQYKALIKTEGIELDFKDNAIDKIAEYAFVANEQMENIGARRLHTIIEKLLEEISYEAPDTNDKNVEIDEFYVEDKLKDIIKNRDLSKYIL